MVRALGTETEYGISAPTWPELSPIITSTHAVVGYAALHTAARSRWDYAEEHPLRDLRGFDLKRYDTVPVVDPNALGVANVVTSAGARFYVDHAHPEYSSPECANAWDAALYDAAGDEVMRQAIAAVAGISEQGQSVLANQEPCPPLRAYKNNVDGKGASYGSHENYQYHRSTDFDRLAQALIPFFVTRQVVTGAGRVGRGADGAEPGFQISQRADYIECEISLETTLNRGIINTRDEPHADASRYGRLHVIIGDANLSHVSTVLKLGMTGLVIDAIEEGVDFSDLQLADAVAEVREVSYDLRLVHRLRLQDGRELSALEILGEYRQRVQPRTAVERAVVKLWDEVAAALADGPSAAAHLIDWAAKYDLVRGFLSRGVDIDDPKLKLVDLQYCDVEPSRSLYHALVRKGRMRALFSEEEIAEAAQRPPSGTRAFLRGRLCERFGSAVISANWQAVNLRCGGVEQTSGEREAIVTIHLDDTLRASQAELGAVVDGTCSLRQLARSLEGLGVRVEFAY